MRLEERLADLASATVASDIKQKKRERGTFPNLVDELYAFQGKSEKNTIIHIIPDLSEHTSRNVYDLPPIHQLCLFNLNLEETHVG